MINLEKEIREQPGVLASLKEKNAEVLTETEYKLGKAAALFLGRQMEG